MKGGMKSGARDQRSRSRGLLALGLAMAAMPIGTGELHAQVCGTPGKDGPGGVLSGVVNTYYPGITATLSPGAISIALGAATGAAATITPGDLLLIIQMQDAAINSNNSSAYGANNGTGSGSTSLNSAGRYEFVTALNTVGAGGGTVTIRGTGPGNGLLNSYTNAAATGSQGQRRYQVIRVPQYSSATLSSGLTASGWNGTVGGVLAIDVAGNLTLGGTVSVDGRGFRGGSGRGLNGGSGGANTDYRNLAANNYHGMKGEGIAGTPRYVLNPLTGTQVDLGIEGYPNGSSARGAPGNAGGGGTDGRPSANDENSGGGGGANAGGGGRGGNSWNSNLAIGGRGGAAFPSAASRVVLGGGGGAGSRNNSSGVASHGGAGGGIVMLRAGSVSGSGTITANGLPGNTPQNDGGGGGGAGGSVVVFAASGGLAGLTVQARGGVGGNADVGGAPHGPGGGGGGGYVALSSAATVDVSGGASGYTVSPGNTYNATAGTPGASVTGVIAADMPGTSPGSQCVPTLSVTKTTSTPTVTNTLTGTTATYTIAVSNLAGRDTARSVVLSDTLPGGFTYASSSAPVLSGGASRPTVSNPSVGAPVPAWGTFVLPGGGSVTQTFTVTIPPGTAGTFQNPAMATYLDPKRTTSGGTTTASYDPTSSTGEDVTVVDSTMGTVTGHVFEDANGDGIQQAGETDLAGVDVVITDTLGGTQTVTTNGSGDYSATVPAGGTTIDVTDPAGSALTTGNDPQTVSVPGAGSQAATPVGFQFLTGSVMGVVFDDVNGNGSQDPGETGLVGVDVIVSNGGFVDTVTTDASGNWTATGVPAGNTTADIDDATLAVGLVQTAGTDPSNVTVVAGATVDAGSDGYQAQADVQVTKLGPAAAEEDGGIINYLIITTNNGPATAIDVVVTDSLPTLGLVDFLSASRGATRVGQLVTWPAITLAPGASVTDTVRIEVDGDQGDPDLVNVAFAQSSTADPDSSDNRSEVTTVISGNPRADLQVTKTAPGSVVVGDTLVYEILTRNLGSNTAFNTVVTDTLPAGVSFISATRSGALAGNVVTWPATSLANGAALWDTVRVVATSAGTQLNVAAATTTTTDPSLANNRSTASTQVSSSSDLAITKTDGVTGVNQGGTVTYTIVVTNGGPEPVIGAAVTDSFPAALTTVGWTCTPSGGASCGSASGTGHIDQVLVDIPAGDTVTFSATGTASGTGVLMNTASVAVPAGVVDPDGTNNSASDNDTQILVIAVAVTPDGADTLRRLPSNGTSYAYTFTVTNNSNVAEAFDLFGFSGGAAVLTVDSIVGPNVTSGAAPDSARLGSFGAGTSDSATVWFSVADTAAGTVDSLYLKARSVANPAVSDSGWVFIQVVKPSITTAKSVSPSGTQLPGTDLTYTIDFTNAGSEDAIAATVVDSLPAEVQFKVGSVITALPAGVGVTLEYSNDGGSTWTYTPVVLGCGAPAGYDACVTHIRWTLTDPLSEVAPDNTGSADFVAQIK